MSKPTKDRLDKIERVAAKRTRNLTIVLEEIYDVGNINACIRSAEAMGILDVHIIEAENTFYKKGKRTSSGAAKWLNVRKWDSIEECLSSLREQGFQIVATTLIDKSIEIGEIDFSCKTALIFGNESQGVSSTAVDFSDRTAFIPMHGFVESYNISVACALSLYTAMLQRGKNHHDQTSEQISELVSDYLKR
ncbi:MAG: RNA methyltransferase [Patescibacteria group bacterium]